MSGAHQKPLNELGAGEIVRGTRSGAFTCEAVARACLDRIAARDSVVHAWVNLDPDLVLKNARALDAAKTRGPLHGVPIGVKDVLDTFDFPTEMGSPIYRKHKPDADAAVVALVRGAVTAAAPGDDAVADEVVRRKAFELLGRDSESLSVRNFSRILRDAHDQDIVDLRRRGDA